MRRVGAIEVVHEIEELLKANKGTRVRRGTGNRGDYAAMGESGPSKKRVISYNVPVALVVTVEIDERTQQGGIRIKDDNLGRLCNKVPGLMEALSKLAEQKDGQ